MNLYNTDNNGTKSFGGVIHTENKGTMMLFDEWNHDSITDSIPVGINLRMMRVMEAFINIPTLNIKAKRNTKN